MESRTVKVSFGKNGQGRTSTSVSMSLIWLKKMGISAENREVKMTFDGKRIIIEPAQTAGQETE